MKIFIAGGTGAIGRRVVPLLRKAGHVVTVVARSREKRDALDKKGIPAVEVNLYDATSVTRAVQGYDTIINLATAVPKGNHAMLPWAWKENDRVRRTVSANLSTAAHTAGATRFIQESFAPIYPDSGDRWLDEAHPVKPASYNRTVLDAEASAARFGESGGTGVVLRFAFFYGPHDLFTEGLIRGARKGWLAIPGSPGGYFSMVHHDDAARAVVASLDVPGGIYNVVEDTPLTRLEMADGLAERLGTKSPRLMPAAVTWLMGSVGELLRRSERISNRKLREASAWQPEFANILESPIASANTLSGEGS